MNASSSGVSHAARGPLAVQDRSLLWKIMAVIAGTIILALSSYISVPMVPVPITLQTLAVPLVGAFYGWRLGGLTIVAWLLEAVVGLPVLAGGGAGPQHFIGPTAGYLFAFPVAGMAMGWLVERGWNGTRIGWAFAAMLTSNAISLGMGAAWLSILVGAERAVMVGVLPFVLGAVLKSAIGAMVLKLATDKLGCADR